MSFSPYMSFCLKPMSLCLTVFHDWNEKGEINFKKDMLYFVNNIIMCIFAVINRL